MLRLFQRGPSLGPWLFLFFLLLAGCGSNLPKVVQVKGTVLYQGKPVPDLYVTFTPPEGRPSWAYTDEMGRFTLRFNRQTEGVHVGANKVTFAFRPRDPKQDMEYQQGTLKLPAVTQAVLDKYGTDNPVEYTITANSQEIELKLD